MARSSSARIASTPTALRWSLQWRPEGSALVGVRVSPKVGEAHAGGSGRLGRDAVILKEDATTDGQRCGDRQRGAPEMPQMDARSGVVVHRSRVLRTQRDHPSATGKRLSGWPHQEATLRDSFAATQRSSRIRVGLRRRRAAASKRGIRCPTRRRWVRRSRYECLDEACDGTYVVCTPLDAGRPAPRRCPPEGDRHATGREDSAGSRSPSSRCCRLPSCRTRRPPVTLRRASLTRSRRGAA